MTGEALALSRSAVDRAGVRRADAAWVEAAWASEAARVLSISQGRTLAVDDPDGRGGPRLVLRPSSAFPADVRRYLLGEDDDGTYFAASVEELAPAEGAAPERVADLRELGAVLSDRDTGLLVEAIGLDNWHRVNRHCSRCGAPTEVTSAGHVRHCPVDGSEHYPRTDPAVIMTVIDADERLLLGHHANWPADRYSTFAGFVEPGESLEAAVAREVLEEVSVVVDDIVYVGSQPWPFPASLMVGFSSRAVGGAMRPDGEEIEEARWFTRDQLQAAALDGSVRLPPPVSIARRLIELWFGGPVRDGQQTW